MHLVGFIIRIFHDERSPERQISNIEIYKIYSLPQISINQLLLIIISHHFPRRHVSAHFYGAIEMKRNM